MQRKSSKHTGNKTKPSQQRINRANSIAALSRLLELNFSAGAHMITLSYAPMDPAFIEKHARADMYVWTRACQIRLGGSFRCARTASPRRDDSGAAVYHVITSCDAETAKLLAFIWPHGPTRVEPVEAAQLPALAERLAGAPRLPNRRIWSVSRNLKRS